MAGSTDIFALGIPIHVNDKAAYAALNNITRVGQQTALQYSTNWTTASNTVITSFTRVEAAGKRANEAVVQSSSAATLNYQKWGNAAIRGAGAVSMMADAASSSDKSLQHMIRTGSGIAFMFGPVGAVVGAVGIGTGLMVSHFEKVRAKIEKTKDETTALLVASRKLTDNPGLASVGTAREQFDQQMRILAAHRAELALGERASEAAQRNFARPADATEESIALARTAPNPARLAFLRGEIARVNEQAAATLRLVNVISAHEAAQKRDEAATRAVSEAAKERLRIIDGEVGWLRELNALGGISIMQVSRARELEITYSAALKDTSLTIEQQTEIIKKRNDAIAAQGVAFNMGRVGGGVNVRRGEGGPAVGGAAGIAARNAAAGIASIGRSADAALESLGSAGAVAFATGFASGLSGALSGAGIDELGKGVLASFGNLLVQLGTQGLIANELVQKLFAFLGTPAGFAAALGMIAVGTALSAFGGGGGGRSRTTSAVGSSRVGNSASAERFTSRTFNPTTGNIGDVTPRESNTYIVLGGGPKVERWVAQIAKKADRRQIAKRGLIRVNG